MDDPQQLPTEVKRRTNFLKKYPKFTVLMVSFAMAYLILLGRDYQPFNNFLYSLGYFGTFLAGVMYAYGFTSLPATAILLVLAQEQNIFLAGLIAGCGALLADLIIFKFIRHSFKDEIEKLSREKLIVHIKGRIPRRIQKWIVPVVASLFIASPLPDEMGTAMLATVQNISARTFAIMCFLLNTTGIFIFLYIGVRL